MAKHLLVVLTNAVSGEREEEFNDWYTNRHLIDVLKVPGYTAATRYAAAGQQFKQEPPPWKYLAIYEVETDDPAETLENLQNSGMFISDALNREGAMAWLYTPITERMTI